MFLIKGGVVYVSWLRHTSVLASMHMSWPKPMRRHRILETKILQRIGFSTSNDPSEANQKFLAQEENEKGTQGAMKGYKRKNERAQENLKKRKSERA